jgi:hypothetical protein
MFWFDEIRTSSAYDRGIHPCKNCKDGAASVVAVRMSASPPPRRCSRNNENVRQCEEQRVSCMDLRTLRDRLSWSLCLAILASLVLTFVAAFAARYTRSALFLLPYGVDAPLGPLANIIRNAFWLFLVLLVVSGLRRNNATNSSAMPILILILQVFVGLVATILLDGIWQSIQRSRWQNDLAPESALVVIVLTVLGQLVAYAGRRAIVLRRSSSPKDDGTK